MTVVAQDYPLLFACYRSGQVSESQWQEHLRDKGLCEWLEEKHKGPPVRLAPCDYNNLRLAWQMNEIDPDDLFFDLGMKDWMYKNHRSDLFAMSIDLFRKTILEAENGDKNAQKRVEKDFGFTRTNVKYERVTGRTTLSWLEKPDLSHIRGPSLDIGVVKRASAFVRSLFNRAL